MTTPADPHHSTAIETLRQRLIDAGCEGDDEQGCTRDDAIVPLEDWCINCLAGHALAALTSETQARQEAERHIELGESQLTAEREARQQAERERDATIVELRSTEKWRVELLRQLTASERARAQAEHRDGLLNRAGREQFDRAERAEENIRRYAELQGQLRAQLATAQERIAEMREALEALNLQPGYEFCCCDMATGDNGATEHHETCLMARAALSAVQARETTTTNDDVTRRDSLPSLEAPQPASENGR